MSLAHTAYSSLLVEAQILEEKWIYFMVDSQPQKLLHANEARHCDFMNKKWADASFPPQAVSHTGKLIVACFGWPWLALCGDAADKKKKKCFPSPDCIGGIYVLFSFTLCCKWPMGGSPFSQELLGTFQTEEFMAEPTWNTEPHIESMALGPIMPRFKSLSFSYLCDFRHILTQSLPRFPYLLIRCQYSIYFVRYCEHWIWPRTT